MSKNIKNKVINIIETKKISIKPKWMFVVGSTLSAIGIVITSVLTLLSIQLIRFRLTHPSLNGVRKINIILASLPWYVPVLAIGSLLVGYYILKRYDFSYKKNFGVIIGIIVVAMIFGSMLLNRLGLDNFLSRRGYFRQIYGQQQPGRGILEMQNRGQVKGRMSR